MSFGVLTVFACSGPFGSRLAMSKPRVCRGVSRMATRPGLEPGIREPKSLVLPITPPGK